MKIKAGVFVLLIIGLYYFISGRKNDPCDWQNSFNKKGITGKVFNKLIDRSQHSTPIIIIQEKNTDHIDTIDLFGEQSNLYDTIKTGDTLYKNVNDYRIYRMRNGVLVLLGDADFGCK